MFNYIMLIMLQYSYFGKILIVGRLLVLEFCQIVALQIFTKVNNLDTSSMTGLCLSDAGGT